MRAILGQLKSALLQLFPTTKYRLILISLVLIAAFISVSELAVAKLFTKIIMHEGDIERTKMAIYIIGFFVFFGATRAAHYFQRIYRVNVFDRAFKANEVEIHRSKENWRWSLAFELTSLLSIFTQMGVIIIFFTFLNWKFGLLNIIVVIVIFQILGRIFRKQITSQRGFVEAKVRKEHVPSSVRIGTRIKSGEIGILLSGMAMLTLFAALIFLSYNGEISSSNTIVLFFGLRMQNSNLSNISSGLMRFARARTHSE